MKYSLSTKNIELTEADQERLDEKLGRLSKYLIPPFHPQVLVQQERHHRSGATIRCRINIVQAGTVLHAERMGATVQEALDEVSAALKRELIKRRDKRRLRR
jgi:ribosomal subunit interface protein